MTLIVCLTALAAVAIIALTVRSIAKDATTTRLALARAGDEQHAGDIRAAVGALERASARIAPPADVTGTVVTVLTRDEQTVHGVLLEEYPDRLLLADAHLITPDGKKPIPGRRTRVYRDRIVLVQEHGVPNEMQGE